MPRKIVKPPKIGKTTHRRERSISLRDSLFRIISIIAAGALLISYLTILINPEFLAFPIYFGLYYIPIAVLNVLILIIALLRHRNMLIIQVIVLAPSLFIADRFIKVGQEEKVLDGENFKLLTYNIGGFNLGPSETTVTRNIQNIKAFLEKENPDIICLQEFSATDTAFIDSRLPDYPYRAMYLSEGSRHCGNVTLSKFPIISQSTLPFPGSFNLCLTTDIQMPDNVFRIYNCHLESYGISFSSIFEKIKKHTNLWDELIVLHGHIKATTIRRSGQVDAIVSDQQYSSYPSIICGDFNETPVSNLYFRLCKRKRDAFTLAGTGISSTFSLFWPLLRIDHVLIPSNYEASDYRVERIPYSDHYPVIVDIYPDYLP